MVAFIHAGECGNINALQPSIQKLMEKIKSMKKHLERVWEDIVHLLEKPFPIQIPATPFECPPDELPSTTCQNPLQLSELRTSCKECGIKRVKLRELLILANAQSQFQTVISKQHDNHKHSAEMLLLKDICVHILLEESKKRS